MFKSFQQEFLLCTILINFATLNAVAQVSDWKAPQSAIIKKNPLPSDASSIKIGKDLYQSNCTPCHGDKGKGDGSAAASLNPPPADHSSTSVQSETDGAIFWKLSEGHNSMPSYYSLNDKQRWAIVNYIRTLAAKGKSK